MHTHNILRYRHFVIFLESTSLEAGVSFSVYSISKVFKNSFKEPDVIKVNYFSMLYSCLSELRLLSFLIYIYFIFHCQSK